MRDGIVLHADIHRPDTIDKYPAIITRTPYDRIKSFSTQGSGYMDFPRMARAGYAVVVQDCRGTGSSEGEFHPWSPDDQADGYDTVEWAVSQPWCNGNVGMYGASHLGFTQWAAAMAKPPHLKAICPAQCAAVIDESPYSKGGVIKWQMLVNWCLNIMNTNLSRSQLSDALLISQRENIERIKNNLQEQYLVLPLSEVPVGKIEDQSMRNFFFDSLKYYDKSDYWQQLSGTVSLQDVAIPAFHIGGWHDHELAVGKVLADFMAMRQNSSSQNSGNNQKLLMGPWSHGLGLSSQVGELDFGLAASGEAIDMTGMHIQWFNYWLKSINSEFMSQPPIRIFVMGSNVWRSESEWPLARTKYVNYYLHSGGKANSRSGDGYLSVNLPLEDKPDSYLYDPHYPVPGHDMELKDAQGSENRQDVLVYSTPVLQDDIEVTGPIEVKLFAASSAIDTDFTVRLLDVWPDEKAFVLVESIVRARYRDSLSDPQFMKPGQVYTFYIKAGSTSNVFKPGHRIRLDISSSSFPKYDRNTNTGQPIGQDSEIKTARQTVFHDKLYPSCVILPVIPIQDGNIEKAGNKKSKRKDNTTT